MQGEACPTPDWQQASLSAYCVLVERMVQEAGIPYNQGPGTLTMIGAVFYNE